MQTRYKMQTADWVQSADLEFRLFFRLIRDNTLSYNSPRVTQSLFRDHPSFTTICTIVEYPLPVS